MISNKIILYLASTNHKIELLMKALVWLFGIFFCASSAYGQKTVTIEGDIRNMPDTVRFFCAEMKGNGMDVRPEDIHTFIKDK